MRGLSDPTAAEQHDFGLMYVRHERKLKPIARAMMRTDDYVDDVLQTAMLQVWRKRKSIARCKGDPTCEEKFLAVAVINCVKNQFRAFKREGDLGDALANDAAVSDYGPEQPDDFVINNERESLIAEAVDRLPPRRRAIFKMSAFERMKHRKIAELLGISVNTVRVHVTEAHTFVNDYLARYEYRKPSRLMSGKKEQVQ